MFYRNTLDKGEIKCYNKKDVPKFLTKDIYQNINKRSLIMNLYYFSIILVVISNTVYHLCQKSTPSSINPLAALTVTYAAALVLSIIGLFIYPSETGILDSFKKLNWASILLGASIVGLELGFLLAYRAGWNISLVGLYANVIVALVLIPIGILFFKEHISITKAIGIFLSITGIVFISMK
jgi:uncharacterized membrane protein